VNQFHHGDQITSQEWAQLLAAMREQAAQKIRGGDLIGKRWPTAPAAAVRLGGIVPPPANGPAKFALPRRACGTKTSVTVQTNVEPNKINFA